MKESCYCYPSTMPAVKSTCLSHALLIAVTVANIAFGGPFG